MLLGEAVAALNIRPEGVYVDGTYGRGGHAARMLALLGRRGRLLVIDKDPEAIRDARQRFGADGRLLAWQGSFACFNQALAECGLPGQVDGLLLDLGVSSPQLDDPQRGFSFMRDGALDMRMNPGQGESAAVWLATAGEAEIADVLWRYGEERFSRKIARAIAAFRQDRPLERTSQLAGLVAQVVPGREPGKHPATRSFQAIRIRVNRELEDVEACLKHAVGTLTSGGRLVVISFHSLEDRIVKQYLRQQSSPPRVPRGLPLTTDQLTGHPALRLVGRAVRPGLAETGLNPRARSAIMRVAEKC